MRRLGWGLAAILLLFVVLTVPLVLSPFAPSPSAPAPTATAAPAPSPSAAPARTTPYRAVWVSYLEWQQVDFSGAEAFSRDIGVMLDHIASLGATVVLAQVRPFGDALYPSEYFPFSHLCTGVQGQDPGFDPLALLVQAAHDRGLELEAWVNPYRLQAGSVPALCDESPAVTHPDWVKATDTGLYLDPASAAVRQYIAGGVEELCQNYDLDGIHFDDYFYPTTSAAFDAAEYAAAGTDLSREDWRRQNVNQLMALCHEVTARYGVRLGVAPLGDPDLCYSGQYSDAALWLAQGGYVDYLMPQLYWGRDYTQNGDTAHSLDTLAARWAALPRAEGVALYVGLGAYRIGDGDGSTADTGEWRSGHALADQLDALESLGIAGAGLYRYASLWGNTAWPDLAEAERQAIAADWVTASPAYSDDTRP